MKNLTKEQWVEMFTEAGLTDEMMKKWHQIFEKKYPDVHQAFLKHLGIEEGEISQIRSL